jgi:hypothetical protein
MRCVSFALVAFALCGCPEKKQPATFQSESEEHSHERDKMLLADAGHYNAALTAHLSSKDGNELDVFFENIENPPKPVPQPLAGFTALARTADGKEHNLTFEPAPANERKDDPDGKCSHFVAKAPWMKADDVLKVTATVMINAKPTQVVWKDFNPKKYAHHID